jgi:hypothetical protein
MAEFSWTTGEKSLITGRGTASSTWWSSRTSQKSLLRESCWETIRGLYCSWLACALNPIIKLCHCNELCFTEKGASHAVFQQSLNNQYSFGSPQQNSSCNKSSNFSQRTVLHWCCQLWEKPSVAQSLSQLHPLSWYSWQQPNMKRCLWFSHIRLHTCQFWSALHLWSTCMAHLPMKGSSLLHALEQLFYAWWQTQCLVGAQHFPDCHSCDRTHHQCSNA